MKPKVVKHLSNIEIDEISLVDRGANQHASVAIAKRAPEEEYQMPELFTDEGTPLDENDLVDGQIVYDEEGNAYQFEADETGEDFEVFDEELVEVGKATTNLGGLSRALKNGYGEGRKMASKGTKNQIGRKYSKDNPNRSAADAGVHFGRNRNKYLGGAGVAGAGVGAYELTKSYEGEGVSKSFSEEVMEELSKAYSDEERDVVLSKALGQVETLLQEQAEAVEIAKAERDLRLTNEYIAKAADYNLPVNPVELGPVLYRMAETMSDQDCMVIAKCLEAAGSAIFDEVGYIGGGDNVDVLGQVNAAAAEYVGKSADMSHAQALDAVFEANPGAYDEYLAQRRGY